LCLAEPPKSGGRFSCVASVGAVRGHLEGMTIETPRARKPESVEVMVETAPGGLVLEPRPVIAAETGLRSGVRDAVPVALAGFAANAANVIVTVLVARLLSTRGYGALAQLTSVFLIVSMPGTAIVVGVVRRVTALSATGRSGPVRDWARRAHAQAMVVVGALALAALLARGLIARELSIPAPLGVFAILVAGFLWVLLSMDRGLLQARRRYRTLSKNLVVEGGTRTVAVLCLVGAGLGVTGAAWGILVAEAITLLHARVAADRAWGRRDGSTDVRNTQWGLNGGSSAGLAVNGSGNGHSAGSGNGHSAGSGNGHAARSSSRSERQRVLLDVFGALVAMALLAYLQNVDVIVLGREAPHASGPYAAISVASKALVFAAIALGGYLLPEAAIEWHRGGHALRQLGVTLLLLAAPGAALLVVSVAFPKWLLSFVFSARYQSAHSAFWLLVVAMAFLSATVVLTTYLLAAGQRWIGGLLLVGAVLATFALAAAHGAPRQTALADLAVQGALAAGTATVFVVVHMRRSSKRMTQRVAT